jgi:hypothetical protein
MNEYCDQLASGICQDFGQYQKLCGVIRGLALAEEYINDLAKKVEKANDE